MTLFVVQEEASQRRHLRRLAIAETGRAPVAEGAAWREVEEAMLEDPPDAAFLDAAAVEASAGALRQMSRPPLVIATAAGDPFEPETFHRVMATLRAQASQRAVAALLAQIRAPVSPGRTCPHCRLS